MKKCPKCKLEKSENDFWKDNTRSDKLYWLCKSCAKENHQRWSKTENGIQSAKRREKKRKPRTKIHNVRRNLKREYDITLEQKIEMFKKQNGLCLMCADRLSETGNIDHDHLTNKIRGLLCRNCNIGLGMFKDSIDILQKAIEYLNKKGT